MYSGQNHSDPGTSPHSLHSEGAGGSHTTDTDISSCLSDTDISSCTLIYSYMFFLIGSVAGERRHSKMLNAYLYTYIYVSATPLVCILKRHMGFWPQL
jgi:hypothetical protein